MVCLSALGGSRESRSQAGKRSEEGDGIGAGGWASGSDDGRSGGWAYDGGADVGVTAEACGASQGEARPKGLARP